MPNIPCPHCGRQISDQSKRCLYCAKPPTGDTGGAVEKRAQMLSAMYSAGVGLPPKQKVSRLEKMRDEPLLVKLAVAVPIMLFGLVWPPAAWRWMKTLFGA